ncbi:MAG: sulfur carrier protein ThiS [Planctomycetota bacterium]
MQVTVNDAPHEVPDGTTVAQLLERLDAPRAGVAVEVNRRIVRKADHAGTALAAGDRVEIVTLVGGG